MGRMPTYEELEKRVRELEENTGIELARSSTYIDAMGDALIVLNPERKVVRLNRTAMRLLGYAEEEIPELTFEKIFPEKEHERHYAEMKVAVETGSVRPIETLLLTKDGREIPIQLSGTVLRDVHGAPIGFVGVGRDITERKRMEEALERAYQELEKRVEARTAELTVANKALKREIEDRKQAEEERAKLEQQLRQSQKMESIGTLAGGIAHDINNILGIIVGNTELAISHVKEPNPARHNLKEVIKASLRARDTVKQILAFSRQTEEERRPVRISPLVEETLKFLRSSTPTIIEIREDYSTRTDIVLGDPSQISQILMNLCTNATHAMREKGGVLEVSLGRIALGEDATDIHHDLTPGEFLLLTVKDTGCGMEEDIVERIFDPYFSTKEVGEGTGMGLAVVHRLVRNHGGAIRVESKPGKGTAFGVFLPLLVRGVEPASEPPGPVPTGSERVLLVDDDEALADLGKRMLQRLGYEVTARTSSLEALETFRAQPDDYDLLVTDMTMPQKTGADLAREVMKIRPGFPVVLCTGFSELITEESAKQLGIKAFVMKPLVVREMAETVRRVLDKEER